MRKPTEFGVAVKTELMLIGQTQKWLREEVNKSTGLFVDSSYMSKILSGERNAPRVKAAIGTILHLPDDETDEGGENK